MLRPQILGVYRYFCCDHRRLLVSGMCWKQAKVQLRPTEPVAKTLNHRVIGRRLAILCVGEVEEVLW